jgi:hypothetical protein
MTKSNAATLLAILLALSTLPGCTRDTSQGRDTEATTGSSQNPCPPPTEGQLAPEETVATPFRQVTTIQNKTQGIIANEPKVIKAAVPNIYLGGTKTGLSGTADGEPYRVLHLEDGQRFEIAGIPFQISIFPDRDEVMVCQLAEEPDKSATSPSP